MAGISRLQRRELEARDIPTLAALAEIPLPLPFTPKRGAAATFERVREQARLQLVARKTQQPVFEMIQPIELEKGLCRLPEPSRRDLFLDLEGDPFAGEGGREYLFGIVSLGEDGEPVYQAFWAETEQEERAAFDSVMSLIMEAWDSDPGMHVYHYAPYEPSAFKRLSCRYAIREQDVDRLLRGGRFVDLYHVVQQGLRAGVERYSIKNLEQFYGYTRSVQLLDASRSLRVMEQALELGRVDIVTPEVRSAVEGYNTDDCLSTLRLRDWLETQRAGLTDDGPKSPGRLRKKRRPRKRSANGNSGSQPCGSDCSLACLLRHRNGRRNSGHVGGSHTCSTGIAEKRRLAGGSTSAWSRCRRKNSSTSRAQLPASSLSNGWRSCSIRRPANHGTVIDRYRYPPQEMEIRGGDDVKLTDGAKFGKVVRQIGTHGRWMSEKERSTPKPIRQRSLPTPSVDRRPRGCDLSGGRRRCRRHRCPVLVQRLLRAEPPTLRTIPFAFTKPENRRWSSRSASQMSSTTRF